MAIQNKQTQDKADALNQALSDLSKAAQESGGVATAEGGQIRVTSADGSETVVEPGKEDGSLRVVSRRNADASSDKVGDDETTTVEELSSGLKSAFKPAAKKSGDQDSGGSGTRATSVSSVKPGQQGVPQGGASVSVDEDNTNK